MNVTVFVVILLLVLGQLGFVASIVVGGNLSFSLAGIALTVAGLLIGYLHARLQRGHHRNGGGPHGDRWPW